MNLTSPAEAAGSEAKAQHEQRLDHAFARFIRRQSESRAGWSPQWTANLRAESWAKFALESRQLVKVSGVPLPWRRFDIESISPLFPEGYRELAAEFLRLLDNPKLLAVGGSRGTGKSVLAYGIVVKFCDLCRPAIYRTAPEMFHELSDAAWEAKQAVRNKLFCPDLLVLDEVQVRDSDRTWQDNELTTLIDRRYREGKATLLLSNLKSTELQRNLGDSIWRRLVETGGLPIETNWPRIEEVKAQIRASGREVKANAQV